jgi:hypothetical protein
MTGAFNGIDVLVIVIVLILIFVGARKLDEHERWINRQPLRKETWRKVAELNGEVIEYEDEG